jgi:acyl dehydratase
MVNRNSLGAVGAVFTFRVETGKIREYASATGATHADHFRSEGAVVHPHFLVTRPFWETEEAKVFDQLQMDYSRGLHAGQIISFYGAPPVAGDVLLAQSRIAKIYEKSSSRSGRMTFVDMITDFRDHDGHLVAEMNTISIELPPDAASAPPRPQAPMTPATNAFIEAGPPERTHLVTRTDLVRFAGASGDFNPVHHDETFSRKAGYPTPLAMGMFHAGLAASWASDWLGPGNVRRSDIRFLDRVFAGESVVVGGGILRRRRTARENVVDILVTGRKLNGALSTRAEMTFAC